MDDIPNIQFEKAGLLSKKSRRGWAWNQRWMLIKDKQLQVFNTESDFKSNKNAKFVAPLKGASVSKIQQRKKTDKYAFSIRVNDERQIWSAPNAAQRDEWIKVIRLNISGAGSLRRISTSTVSIPGKHEIGSSLSDSPPQSPESPHINVDWNTQYQKILTMPEDNLEQSTIKGKKLKKLVEKFCTTASSIAISIIEDYALPRELKRIVPVEDSKNAPEDDSYVERDIIFTFAQNSQDVSIDEASMKIVTQELHGISAYASVNRKNLLHTPLCCAIDYMGFRIRAMAIVPVFDDTSELVFGRRDEEFASTEEAVKALQHAARRLNLKVHALVIGDESLSIPGSSHMKMYKCFDDCLYITNLEQVFPADFTDSTNDPFWTVKALRSEFVKDYAKPLSSDAYGGTDFQDGETDDLEVATATQFLHQVLIPEFIEDLDLLQIIPVNGGQLVKEMHQAGINARYLGRVAQLTRLVHVRDIALSEMVARICKRTLNRKLRNIFREIGSITDKDTNLLNLRHLKVAVVDFFNLVLGSSDDGKRFWSDVVKKVKGTYKYTKEENVLNLSPSQLFLNLQRNCGVQFENGDEPYEFKTNKVSPLNPSNLLSVNAKVKHSVPHFLKCQRACDKLEEHIENGEWRKALESLSLARKVSLKNIADSNTAKWEALNQECATYIALKEYTEAMKVARRILDDCPRFHLERSAAFANVMKICMCTGKDKEALQNHENAFQEISSQAGQRHPLVIELHRSLAQCYLQHDQADQADQAALYFQKAVDVAVPCLGNSHPTLASLYTALGSLFFDEQISKKDTERNLENAEELYHKALLIYEAIFGHMSLNVASCCFHLAQIYLEQQEAAEARRYAQRSYDIRSKVLGDNHSQTLESCYQMAWLCDTLENNEDAITYFENLLNHFKSSKSPDERIKNEIHSLTKNIVRIQLTLLSLKDLANLNHIYKERKLLVKEDRINNILAELINCNPAERTQEIIDLAKNETEGREYVEACLDFTALMMLNESED